MVTRAVTYMPLTVIVVGLFIESCLTTQDMLGVLRYRRFSNPSICKPLKFQVNVREPQILRNQLDN